MTHAARNPVQPSYDHIIIGGGSAGCVVAARLSEQGDRRVLLVEAGGPDFDRPSMVEPGRWLANWGSDATWLHQTIPQANLDGRVIDWNRGKVLGGSSTINAMTWVWGHRADFDGWATEGNSGWDFASLKPIFRQIETCGRVGPEGARGTRGPMQVYSFSDKEPLVEAFLAACSNAGHALVNDVNGPDEEGASAGDMNVRDGRRFSVAQAYLLPVLGRGNLTVLTHTLIESLTFEGTRCIGIRCLVDDQPREIRSDHDVVLAAGSIESPRLLMVSGVGNADHLTRFAIRPVADLPGVGENLHDHCLLRTFTTEREWGAVSPRLEAHLLTRSNRSLPLPDLDIGLTRASTFVPGPRSGGGFTLLAGLFRPRSRGRLALTAADVRAPLHIDPKYLSDPADMDALCAGAEASIELGMASALSRWHDGELQAAPSGRADLRGFIKRTVGSYNHPVGTCAMGLGKHAVVDPTLRVHGISNLRVADASVMPDITTGHTLAPTLVIAEKAASLIGESSRR
jgi:choline dehydrogenase